jgi:hypothetical protein
LSSGIYAINRWLDINESDILIMGTKNTVIVIKDSANVGGFRIGKLKKVKNILIQNITYDGNYKNQDQKVPCLHGICFYSANNCKVKDCFIRKTSPNNKHGFGGCGIVVRRGSSNIEISKNMFSNIGDRAINVGGKHIDILDNIGQSSFDRFISLSVNEMNCIQEWSSHVNIIGNIGMNCMHGSVIGVSDKYPDMQSNRNKDIIGHYYIANNTGLGYHRSFIKLFNFSPWKNNMNGCSVTIENNIGVGDKAYYEGIIIEDFNRSFSDSVIIKNNLLINYSKTYGVRISRNLNCFFENNKIIDCGNDKFSPLFFDNFIKINGNVTISHKE